MEEKSQIFKIRHSLAHVLAQAVQHIYPDAKLGIGPAIENGFYYDFIFTNPISEEDLGEIEKEMRRIILREYDFIQSKMKKEEALEYLYKLDQPFKAEIASELEDKELGFYEDGDFKDLCKGPHVQNTREIPLDAFKLERVAGAYWKGDESRTMMQRVYGLAFETKEELDKFVEFQEEAKKRDHRKLGKQLGLFTFSDFVGGGLPMFTPKGTYLRTQVAGFSEDLQKKGGFEQVWIPHITKPDLYILSGHWDKYKEDLFLVKSQQGDTDFVMKPMNCPHHSRIYMSEKRSYRDLPIRYFETTTVYRDEKAGELSGISRVRSATQDDGHIFCTLDQIDAEFKNIMRMIQELYDAFGMKFKARLSFRDPNNLEKYLGEDENWVRAQKILEDVVKEMGLEYFIGEGEAAFYGPKIDIMVTDAIGREHQCATEQLDFVQPARLGLTYTDKDGEEKVPVMIHKALLGSIERFLSVYIEHTAGNFPLWLCYTQGVVVPVSNEKHSAYAEEVGRKLKELGLRVNVDLNNETMGNKIRKAQEEKMPYMFVVGDKEQETNTLAVRLRNGTNLGMMKVEEIAERMHKEIESKN